MNIEYEVKFLGIDPSDLRKKLHDIGAIRQFAMTDMKRKIFDTIPRVQGKYLRVRDEGNKTTMTFKHITEENLDTGVRELEVEVSDFDDTCGILEAAGFKAKAFQETRREKRVYLFEKTAAEVEVVIDHRPGLNIFVEIEGSDIESIRGVSALLGFDYDKDGVFGTVAVIAEIELGLSQEYVNSLSIISFENPIK